MRLLRGALTLGAGLVIFTAAGCGGVGVPTTKQTVNEAKAPATVGAKTGAPAAAGSPAAKVVDVPAKRLVSSDGSTPGPNDGNTTAFDQHFLEEITKRSGGKITWDKNWGGSLLTYTKALQGTREAIADLTSIPYNFNPSFFPLTNVVLDVGYVVKDIYAGMQAASELIETNPHIQKEWAAVDLKPIPTAGTPWAPRGVMCRTKIASLADFRGKRVRTTSEAEGAVTAALGGTPVRMDTTEVYEALERGAIDCVMTSAAAARSQKWAEPSKWFLVIPELGVFSCCYRAMNLKTWDSLPPETQQLILAVAKDSWVPVGEIILSKDVEEVFVYAAGLGVEVVRSSPEFGRPIQEANLKNRDAWLKRVKDAGNPNGEAVLADWERIADKWNKKIEAEGYPWQKKG